MLRISIALAVVLASCAGKAPVVKKEFVDSLLIHYSLPAAAKAVEEDVRFWENRMTKQQDNFVAKEKYAFALINRFHLYSDIRDLKMADSILVALTHAGTGESLLLALATVRMLQHQFMPAADLINKVKQTGAERYATSMLKFDADFETGNYSDAKLALFTNKHKSDFGYHFRLAKLHHFSGGADSAIFHMMKAASVTSNVYTKSAALSNAADLHLHSGEVDKAYNLYKESITNNAADFHSIGKVGWIALVHDKNDSLARKIFHFILSKTKSPDVLLTLSQSYELIDNAKALGYAQHFEQKASNAVYGDMYNKYLIQVYTGLLNQPSKAVAVAMRELQNRKTPQTYSWLAWSLAADKKIDEAYSIFKTKVSGKALEGYELFLMGKLMQAAGKNYNAHQFFKEAEKNKYDLSPAMQKELEDALK